MGQALQLARKGWGKTHPNPMVGAVVVDLGVVRGEGFHHCAGEAHAEINALDQIKGSLSEDATLYVTLEPCSTHGRTPPCVEAIINSGIKRVIVGATDPNPQHAGQGLNILKNAGIKIEAGILGKECEDLNLVYNYWIEFKSPLLAAKLATTMDGRIATSSGHSKWISGPQARKDVMLWRRLFPAIAVGAKTVLSDNPNLSSRRAGEDDWCPKRIIIDPHLITVMKLLPKVYSDADKEKTIVVTDEDADTGAKKRLLDSGISLWEVTANKGLIDWSNFRQHCINDNLIGVYFEGGAKTVSSLLNSSELNYLFCYRAPKILADSESLPAFHGRRVEDMNDAITLEQVCHATFEGDELMRGYVTYPD